MKYYSTETELIQNGQTGDCVERATYSIAAVSPSGQRVIVRNGHYHNQDGIAHFEMFARSRPTDSIASNTTLPIDDFLDYCGSDWK